MEVVPCVCDEEDVENVMKVRLPIFIYDTSIVYLSSFFQSALETQLFLGTLHMVSKIFFVEKCQANI
jgi:hypothetical protein